MTSCRKCEHYQPKDLEGFTLLEKFQSVSGFCMDSDNPNFNEWAREFGRGTGRFESYISPNWCAKRKNQKETIEHYTEEEIKEFIKEEKTHQRYREFIKKVKNMSEEEFYNWMGVK